MARILVLDDDAAVDRLKRQIPLMGHEVVAARADAYTALGHVAREHADLIMVGMNLPGGGGASVVARLRADAATMKTPVIVLFGDDDATEGVEVNQRTRMLQKPTDFDTMKILFNELLPRPAKPAAPAPAADPYGGLPPMGPPPQSGRANAMDMGSPSDDDLPPGEILEL